MEHKNKIIGQLDNLFEEWIKQSKKNHEPVDDTPEHNIIFTRDGIVEKADKSIDVIKGWEHSDKRIAFLLKDQNTMYPDDLTKTWIKDEKFRELIPTSNNFFPKLAFAFWALKKCNKGNVENFVSPSYNSNFKDIKDLWNNNAFALIETKKQGGGPEIKDAVLKTYLNRYGDLLSQELDILSPNIIVCCGQEIYNFIINSYFKGTELLSIPKFNSVRIDPRKKTVILCSYHPSKPMSIENFYSGIMNHYIAYLKSNI